MSERRFENPDQVEKYRTYRPKYPPSLYKIILEYVRRTECDQRKDRAEKLNKSRGEKRLPLAIDVGCGPGHTTTNLAPHFDQILGIDVSPAQIQLATATNSHQRVKFRVSEAENIPVDDLSADLITVGMTLHWLDHERFYSEVERVLRPGGVVAAYMYDCFVDIVDHYRCAELTPCIHEVMEFMRQQKAYWPTQVDYLVRRYTDDALQIPYPDCLRNEKVSITVDTTIEGLFEFLKTGSALYKYARDNGENGEIWWKSIIGRFCRIYGSDDIQSPVTYTTNMVLLMGRKPALVHD